MRTIQEVTEFFFPGSTIARDHNKQLVIYTGIYGDVDNLNKKPTEKEDFIYCVDGKFPYWFPKPGDVWHWQPMISTATERIKVTAIKLNEDNEIWVGMVKADRLGWKTEEFWNELPHFFASAVLIQAAEEE